MKITNGTLSRGLLLTALVMMTTAALPALAAAPPTLDISGAVRADAGLHDVHFVDPDHGWAVGDLGVILHTSDGGETWRPQSSGTTCALHSVWFTSTTHGFAAGGWYEADTQLSRCVLLRTRDGGRTWKSLPVILPRINDIYQSRGGTLCAVGDWSPFQLGRLFVSDDQGDSWRSVDGTDTAAVVAGSVHEGTMVLADEQGMLLAASDTGQPPKTVGHLPGVRRIVANGNVWAAALADGRVGVSRDSGRQWSVVAPPEPFVPTCMAVGEDGRTWFAGAPGDRVVTISPSGTLESHSTGATLPLRGLFFLDQHRGWAVGGYGQILATRDGGRSWRSQTDSDRRAMVLCVARNPAALPWPLMASESLEYGRRVAMAIAAPRAGGDPLVGDMLARAASAGAGIGGAEAIQWDGDAQAADTVIVSYRPQVVVISTDLTTEQREAWLRAAIQGDVARIYDVTEAGRADITIHTSAIFPIAAALAGDVWFDALTILGATSPVPDRLMLRRCWDRTGAIAPPTGNSVADGLPVFGATRGVVDGRRRNLQILQARSGEQAILRRLVREASKQDDAMLRRHLRLLVDQTPRENQERLLRAVLHQSRFESSGGSGALRLHLAALSVAASLDSESSLARWAALRLAAIQRSPEWREMLADCLLMPEPATQRVRDAVAVHRSPFERDMTTPSDVIPVAVIEHMAPVPGAARHASGVPGPESKIAEAVANSAGDAPLPPPTGADNDMLWRMHPAHLLWWSAAADSSLDPLTRDALRRLGETESAQAWQALVSEPPEDRILAAAVSTAKHSTTPRPVLDGVLDDACWRNRRTTLGTGLHGSEIHVALAYDSEFLYVAVEGIFAEGDKLRPVGHRDRDGMSMDQPHLRLEIDVDRDLLTKFEFHVDTLGQTRDSCDGFPQWQPRWSVASGCEGGRRTIEAAIRRSDLTALPPAAGDRWRVRVTRVPAGGNPRQAGAGVADPEGWQTMWFQ